ncbi:MAG: hypothetical protein DMF60_12110 [Acidobacteria bacterium]|nr:MAG: hypothetical protein DMF60_12110 [Acidobacteriota bacterium]
MTACTVNRRGEELQDQCPDLETLAAYLDHKLTFDENQLVESHLLRCSLCRQTASEAVKTETKPPAPTPHPDSADS